MWTATLYTSNGQFVETIEAPDTKELHALMRKWVLRNGDTIKIQGPRK